MSTEIQAENTTPPGIAGRIGVHAVILSAAVLVAVFASVWLFLAAFVTWTVALGVIGGQVLLIALTLGLKNRPMAYAWELAVSVGVGLVLVPFAAFFPALIPLTALLGLIVAFRFTLAEAFEIRWFPADSAPDRPMQFSLGQLMLATGAIAVCLSLAMAVRRLDVEAFEIVAVRDIPMLAVELFLIGLICAHCNLRAERPPLRIVIVAGFAAIAGWMVGYAGGQPPSIQLMLVFVSVASAMYVHATLTIARKHGVRMMPRTRRGASPKQGLKHAGTPGCDDPLSDE